METATETTLPEVTRIKIVSVKVSRQVDLGFVPYIEYLKKLGNKQAPFGTRDQSRAEFDVFVSAEVGTNDSVDNVVNTLSDMAHEMSNNILREQYPDAFKAAVEAQVPEEAVIISRTTVERVAVGDF